VLFKCGKIYLARRTIFLVLWYCVYILFEVVRILTRTTTQSSFHLRRKICVCPRGHAKGLVALAGFDSFRCDNALPWPSFFSSGKSITHTVQIVLSIQEILVKCPHSSSYHISLCLQKINLNVFDYRLQTSTPKQTRILLWLLLEDPDF